MVYFACDIGQSYFIAPYSYQRHLIGNAVRWAAGTQSPQVEIEAPKCVISNVFRQPNHGGRYVVHLLNEINSTGGRAWPSGNPPMREEVVPIHNIRVVIRDPNLQRATLQPEGLLLPLQRNAQGTTVTVPELKLHSMVVAEF